MFFFSLRYSFQSLRRLGSSPFYGYMKPIANPRNKDRQPVLNRGDDYAYITRKVLFCFAVTFNISRNYTVNKQVNIPLRLTVMTANFVLGFFLVIRIQQ